MIRVLVDGNNLMFALRDEAVEAGREMLCRLLGQFAERTGLAVAVIFDGASPPAPLAGQIADPRIEVHYSGHRTADAVLEDILAAHSAPRRLTVVSTDHEIVHLARHRRSRSVRSDVFARQLIDPPPPKPGPDVPSAKRTGLAEGEAEQWMHDLGLDDDA
jgi:hypothetical protein